MTLNGKANGSEGQIYPVVKTGTSQIWILNQVTDKAAVQLGEGEVFVCLMTGSVPAIVAFDPGVFDVDADAFGIGVFPIVIIRMTTTESERFKTLPIEIVDAFLSKLRISLRSTSGKGFPGFEQWYDLNGKRTKFKIAGFPLEQSKTLITLGDNANDN